jgi:hypothetical protein
MFQKRILVHVPDAFKNLIQMTPRDPKVGSSSSESSKPKNTNKVNPTQQKINQYFKVTN